MASPSDLTLPFEYLSRFKAIDWQAVVDSLPTQEAKEAFVDAIATLERHDRELEDYLNTLDTGGGCCPECGSTETAFTIDVILGDENDPILLAQPNPTPPGDGPVRLKVCIAQGS